MLLLIINTVRTDYMARYAATYNKWENIVDSKNVVIVFVVTSMLLASDCHKKEDTLLEC